MRGPWREKSNVASVGIVAGYFPFLQSALAVINKKNIPTEADDRRSWFC